MFEPNSFVEFIVLISDQHKFVFDVPEMDCCVFCEGLPRAEWRCQPLTRRACWCRLTAKFWWNSRRRAESLRLQGIFDIFVI